ncbi:ubiquitin-like domain-containing protein [Solicola sp. PLA-1-18]|uniref:ubiquitin-like domain-containing protein n=1 Tax=Solicola sp. PLA-1-18 TaxID=3380532 RepID=UPI003B7C3CF8
MRQRRVLVLALNVGLVLVLVGGTLGFTAANKTVTLAVDGQEQQVRTFGGSVADVLEKKDISIGEHDVVAPSADSAISDGTRVSVRYGRPLTLRMDDGTEQTYWTTADNVDDALSQLDLRLAGADLSTSRSASLPREGLDVQVTLPRAMSVQVDGATRTLSSTGPTVGDALREAGITVDADDEVEPAASTPVANGAKVTVTRIETQTKTRTDTVEHDTTVREDDAMDEGDTKVVRKGVDGQEKVTYRVVLADGKVRKRTTISRSTVREPVDQVERRGTKSDDSGSGGSSNSSDSGPGSDADFIRLAQCESGGNWKANTGNGYYGGVQFSAQTWRAMGGSGLPHQNSKAEQIRIAKKLQAQSGWGQWPACSRKLGLR